MFQLRINKLHFCFIRSSYLLHKMAMNKTQRLINEDIIHLVIRIWLTISQHIIFATLSHY